MKRKPPMNPEPVISPEILEEARRSLDSDRVKPMGKCFVCGGEATPNPVEQLCWVCRRLKFSAWRENDSQAPAQE
jgi:hypothetical protein